MINGNSNGGEKSCPCVHHEDYSVSKGTALLILNLSTMKDVGVQLCALPILPPRGTAPVPNEKKDQ